MPEPGPLGALVACAGAAESNSVEKKKGGGLVNLQFIFVEIYIDGNLQFIYSCFFSNPFS